MGKIQKDGKRTKWWSRTKNDFVIDWYSGTGAGGQHRNRKKCCCRLVDKETGIITTGQESRSRKQNMRNAFRRMVDKLVNFFKEKEPEWPRQPMETIRTYNEHFDRVTDHQTGKQYSFHNTVGRGDLSRVILDRRLDMQKEENGT